MEPFTSRHIILIHGLRLKPRSKYLSLFSTALHRAIAYRQAALLSVVANLVWVAIPYFLWHSVYNTRAQIGSFDWDRMRTYILVAYGVNMLLSFRVEARIFDTIRTGNISVELMRPIHYLLAQLAEASGAAVIDGVLSLPFVLVFGMLVSIQPPMSLVTAGIFMFSVVLGFLVKFMISYITSLMCFWTMNAFGLLWARAAITDTFSGALIPLEFLPNLLQTLAYLSPFQAIVHIPLAIYFGDVQGTTIVQMLTIQVFWIVVLWIFARALWRPSLRTLTVQGG